MKTRRLSSWIVVLYVAQAWPGVIATAQEKNGDDAAPRQALSVRESVPKPLDAELYQAIGRATPRRCRRL